MAISREQNSCAREDLMIMFSGLFLCDYLITHKIGEQRRLSVSHPSLLITYHSSPCNLKDVSSWYTVLHHDSPPSFCLTLGQTQLFLG